MYLPPGSRTLKDVHEQQIRLCLQGYPKTGKTTSATTFPNPIFLNYDRGLSGFNGREDIVEVPLWSKEYRKTIWPSAPDDLKTILPIWLDKEAIKLEPHQTLVVDGSTAIQTAYHKYMSIHPHFNSAGRIDARAEWGLKIPYFSDIFECFKTLKCHVIYICHESVDRDSSGELNGKIRPLLSGQAGDQLAGHFTDYFRQHAFAKPTDYDKAKPEAFGMTKEEFKKMCESVPGNTIYAWQTQSDDIANCGSSTLKGQPRYIKADYKTFISYMKPISVG